MQVHWINDVNEARERRRRQELETSARRFSEEIDRQLLSVIPVLQMRHGGEEALQSIAPDPKLIASIQRVTDPFGRFGFDSDLLTLTVPAGEERSHEFVRVQFDSRELTQRIIPELVRRDFDRADVTIVRRGAVVYQSTPAWNGANADLTWPLLLAKHKIDEGRLPQSSWQLLVRNEGQPIAAMIATARVHDFVFAFAILIALGASIVVLAAATRRAERLRRQQMEFVAGITHELHTPLAALAAAGQNLADSVPVDTARYGDAIVKETRRLADLVDDVLQFGGIEGRTKPRRDEIIDPHSTIDDAIADCRRLAEERGVTIESNGTDTPPIRGDRFAVTRAVQNLIGNAIRHGGSGGWVGVRAETENGFVVIRVEDRGDGIAPVDLPHVFEPFYRGRNAQTRGSGLGLAVVDRVARMHGGSISVTKGRERGAEFILRLPASRPA